MNKIIKLTSIFFMVICLSSCTFFPFMVRWRPIKPRKLGDNNSIVFQHPVDIVRKAAIYTATEYYRGDYKIIKSEPYYFELYFIPTWENIQVGIMGGETVGIWLEPLGESQTRVVVSTALSKGLSWLAAAQGSKNREIIGKLKKYINRFERAQQMY